MSNEIDEKLLPEVDDPLLDCLVFVSKKYGINLTEETVRSHVATTEKLLTPGLLVQTAEALNLSCKFLKRRISKISKLLLPTILLLKEGRACVLISVDGDSADVYFSESGAQKISLDELKEEYSGFAFFIKPRYDFETRSDEKKLFTIQKNWFWGTLLRHGELYSRVIIASIFINLFVIATPLFIMNVYDRVVPNQAMETLWVLTVGILLVFGFDFLLKNLRAYFIDNAGKKVDIILSSALLEKTLNTPMNDQPQSPGVRANQIREFEFLRDFFSSATVATLVDLPFVLIFISIIGFIGGKLALIPTQSATLVIISSILISIPLMRAVKQSFVGNGQKAALLHETISGVETIKSTTSQGYFLGRWQKYVALAASHSQVSRFWSTMAVLVTGLLITLTTVAVVVWGVYLIRDGELTVGGLIACTILTGRALAPLGQIASILTRYQQAKCSLTALDDLMQSGDERQRENSIQINDLQGSLELDEVCFRYQGKTNNLMDKFSLKINPGEKVAILGNIGSGKSTLLKLLQGLYIPNDGSVRVDGIDLRQLDMTDFRKKVGYLDQKPTLFFGTLRENIALKAPWVDDEQVLAAAKLSGAISFIGKDPKGFGIVVSEGGKGLSGGQIQAVSLARTLLLDPKIILLDEPTSSMDTMLERHFIEGMKTFCKDKTLVLSTYKNALLELVDRIVVIQDGAVVIDGPKQEVLNKIAAQVNERRDS